MEVYVFVFVTIIVLQGYAVVSAGTCIPGWSTWVNRDKPNTGDGDHESMSPSELSSVCGGGKLTRIECSTVAGIPDIYTGELLTCSVDRGLDCLNIDNVPVTCSDYKVRYSCNCSDPTCICINGGYCMEGSSQCICPTGFTGKTCESEICSSQPCTNGGTCVAASQSYSCNCAAGYTGSHCEVNIDECSSQPCHHNGTCLDGTGSYSCMCNLGYTGSQCEFDINECSGRPCRDHGICVNTLGSYKCLCSLGYEGLHCEHRRNACASSPCGNNGVCADHPDGFQCSCSAGYTGRVCDLDLDECAVSVHGPCQHNGTCVNTVGSYMCSCTSGFSSYNCGQDINECEQMPCKSSETCVNTYGSYICLCGTELGMFNCNQIPSLACQNHGSVVAANNGKYVCRCLTGYTGERCEIKISNCSSSPCANGGSCEELPSSFNCHCRAGFYGNQCEMDYDECQDQHRCQYGCVNTIGSYKCTCPNTMTKDECKASSGMATTPSLSSLLKTTRPSHSKTTQHDDCADKPGFPCTSASGFCSDDHIAATYCQKTCGRCHGQDSALIG